MPRIARVVQRGHNRQAVFAEAGDYRYYLGTLETFKQVYDAKIYGFCLMRNLDEESCFDPPARRRGC